jgi:hypothetical protein
LLADFAGVSAFDFAGVFPALALPPSSRFRLRHRDFASFQRDLGNGSGLACLTSLGSRAMQLRPNAGLHDFSPPPSHIYKPIIHGSSNSQRKEKSRRLTRATWRSPEKKPTPKDSDPVPLGQEGSHGQSAPVTFRRQMLSSFSPGSAGGRVTILALQYRLV